VSGKDVGYGWTCTMLLLAAVTILRESDKMPGRYLPTLHITNNHCGTTTVRAYSIFLIQFKHYSITFFGLGKPITVELVV
jgi:hypothetical protein